MKNREHPSPGEELLSSVRAGFVLQGTSLSEWCETHQLARQNVRVALLGGWNGQKAQEIRYQVVEASRQSR